jgi:hypothetical protein
VGHIARVFEEAGIPSVAFGVQAFKSRMLPMSIPRLVLTPELMGKTLGRPGDNTTQLDYLRTGLDLLENASGGKTLVEFGINPAFYSRNIAFANIPKASAEARKQSPAPT